MVLSLSKSRIEPMRRQGQHPRFQPLGKMPCSFGFDNADLSSCAGRGWEWGCSVQTTVIHQSSADDCGVNPIEAEGAVDPDIIFGGKLALPGGNSAENVIRTYDVR